MHRVGIIVFDGVTLLDASGPAEVFRLADPAHERYELVFVSPAGGSVSSSSGIEVSGTIAAADAGPLDTLLVAGGENLTRPDVAPALLEAVDLLAAAPQLVASVCTGAFVLANLGFLDDRRATTHWRHAQTLAKRYPNVRVEPDVIHIRDGRFMTSAGISAGIDLALAIVEDDLGASAARAVAQEMVMFMRRPGGQSQFSAALRHAPPQTDRLRTLFERVTTDPSAPHTVASMAALVGVSERHLNRLFREDLGSTPARWLEEIRVDAARALILEGHTITRTAQLCGFGTDERLRRAFARHLNTTPTAFRERFATTKADG